MIFLQQQLLVLLVLLRRRLPISKGWRTGPNSMADVDTICTFENKQKKNSDIILTSMFIKNSLIAFPQNRPIESSEIPAFKHRIFRFRCIAYYHS